MNLPWACPVCLSLVAVDGPGPGLVCGACGAAFRRSPSGRPDFRPQSPLTLRLDYRYDPEWGRMPWGITRLDWPGSTLPFDAPTDWEATELSVLRAVPPAPAGARALDLGCGIDHQRFADPLRRLGYEHVGVDIDGAAPDALADIHLLPFADASFDLLVTSAVFEHVKQPHVAMAEAARVARPGALFVGTVAFSEPYHISYFHHSPLAVQELLESTGFEIQHVILSNEWSAFQAHLEMGFAGARYPAWMRTAVSRTFLQLTLIPARIKRLVGRGPGSLEQDKLTFAKSHSALVGFVARRNPGPAPTRVLRGRPDVGHVGFPANQ